MQSKFFFTLLFCCLSGAFLSAQDKADLNLEYSEGKGFEAQMWLSTNFDKPNLKLMLYGAEVLEVRLAQGRLKQALPFRLSADTLLIELPPKLDPRSRIYIAYRYTWESLAESPFVELLKPGLVFNAFNLEEGARSGTPGWLIPSRNGSFDELRIGMIYPKDLNLGIPLEEDYEIELKGSKNLRYFQSEAPVDMVAFYLVFGDFRRFDPEDVLEDLAENEELLEKSRLAQFEATYGFILDYVSREYGFMLTNEALKELEELEERPAPQGFWSEGLEAKMSRPVQNKTYAILANFEKDEDRLFKKWFDYCRNAIGAQRWSQNLESHYANGDTSNFFWSYFLADYLKQHQLSWADTSKATKSKQERFYLSMAQSLYHRKKAIDFKVSYRLKNAQQRMEFYLEQADTNISISGSLKAQIVFKDSTVERELDYLLGERDTIYVNISESPRSLYLSIPEDRFLSFKEERPLTYWLYDLNKAPEEAQRRRALLELMEIANPNLLATVVGVALDSGEPELQLLALSKVKDLRPDGLRRLESTLKAMAQDESNVKLMQKTKALVQEIWPE